MKTTFTLSNEALTEVFMMCVHSSILEFYVPDHIPNAIFTFVMKQQNSLCKSKHFYLEGITCSMFGKQSEKCPRNIKFITHYVLEALNIIML